MLVVISQINSAIRKWRVFARMGFGTMWIFYMMSHVLVVYLTRNIQEPLTSPLLIYFDQFWRVITVCIGALLFTLHQANKLLSLRIMVSAGAALLVSWGLLGLLDAGCWLRSETDPEGVTIACLFAAFAIVVPRGVTFPIPNNIAEA